MKVCDNADSDNRAAATNSTSLKNFPHTHLVHSQLFGVSIVNPSIYGVGILIICLVAAFVDLFLHGAPLL
jgi:hypothetical protein